MAISCLSLSVAVPVSMFFIAFCSAAVSGINSIRASYVVPHCLTSISLCFTTLADLINGSICSQKKPYTCSMKALWSRRESNPYLTFRKRLFYPLNYATKNGGATLTARLILQKCRKSVNLPNRLRTRRPIQTAARSPSSGKCSNAFLSLRSTATCVARRRFHRFGPK